MLLAVAIPILTKTVFPEVVSKQAKMVFDSIEEPARWFKHPFVVRFRPSITGRIAPDGPSLYAALLHQRAQTILHGALATWFADG